MLTVNIIIGTSKIIARSYEYIWDGFTYPLVLIVSSNHKSIIEARFARYFHKIIYINDEQNADEIIMTITGLLDLYHINRIIPLSEKDLLIAASFNHLIDNPWLSYECATVFRNKLAMKNLVSEYKLCNPRYREVKHALDLFDFIEEVGYPVILKPKDGRGSQGIHVLYHDIDLKKIIIAGICQSDSPLSTYIIEEYFTDVEHYRVDGLIHGKKPVFIIPAKYIGSHLRYLQGEWLGSHLLSATNPIKEELVRFAVAVMKALPHPNDCVFHMEIFNKQGTLYFGEVGLRLGGGSVVDEIYAGYKINLLDEYCHVMGNTEYRASTTTAPITIAGQLHIAPKQGKLLFAPDFCDHENVLLYELNHKPGAIMSPMKLTNAELARFVFHASTEQQACKMITQLKSWFNQQIKWEVV